MERTEIKKLSEKNYTLENNLSEIKKEYEVSFGKYEPHELKKTIDNKSPFFISDKFIIGYQNNDFISDKNEKVVIERMVKAVIVEDIRKEDEVVASDIKKKGDYFAIIGKNNWPDGISEFKDIFGDLRVGEIYLPPHSVVFNFLIPTEKEIKAKIVSELSGINVNVYSKDNYIDNCMHEIGHLFWRDVLKYEEKTKIKEHFDHLKPCAIYEYDWEKENEEEVFCTLYKWKLKSILLNPSFYNILEFEDAEGLKILNDIMVRISKDKIISDIWELNKESVFEYLNPRFDITTGRKIIRKGLFDEIKDIELPDDLLNNVDSFQDGVTFIQLNKAIVPVKDNRIDWEEMEKARITKYKSKKPDGKGGWIYDYGKDEKKKSKGIKEKIYFDESGEIASRFGDIEKTSQSALSKCDAFDSTIKNKEIERCGVFDKNGNLILEKDGQKSSISFFEDEKKKMMGMEIFTHNHPGGRSFSFEDVIFAAKNAIKEIRAVGASNIYVLKINYKNAVKTQDDIIRGVQVLIKAYKEEDSNVEKIFRNKINDESMSINEAEIKHHHEVWQRVFSDQNVKKTFNIKYEKKEV